jgi:hypothetical protein
MWARAIRHPTRRRRSVQVDPVLDEVVVIESDVATSDSGRAVADLFTPRDCVAGTSIVLVHGCCGSKSDLTQLAVGYARAGARVCNAGWRGLLAGGSIDDAVTDITDAVMLAWRRWGSAVTLVAWADGALAAIVAASDAIDHGDGVVANIVGLGGYYGWGSGPVPDGVVNERTTAFIGGTPDQVPDRWIAANPYTHIDRVAFPPVALLVGDADVQQNDTMRFRDALVTAGRRVVVRTIADCDHFAIVVPRLGAGRAALDEVLAVARSCPA